MRLLLRVIVLVTPLLAAVSLTAQSLDVELQRAVQREIASGDVKRAIEEYRRIADRAGSNRAVAAQALLRLAEAHQKLGDAEASRIYEQIVARYSDQTDVATTARARLTRAGTDARESSTRVSAVRLLDGDIDYYAPTDDGRYVPYIDANAIHLLDLGTGRARQIVAAPKGKSASLGSPTLAHNGRQMAYMRYNDFNTPGELHVLDLASAQDRLVMRTNALVADWSPDDRQLLLRKSVTSAPGGPAALQIVVLDIDSTRERVVLEQQGRPLTIRTFSPDGKWIAFQSLGDAFVVSAAGGQPQIVSPHAARDLAVGWSGDGLFVFASDRSGTLDLYAQRLDNGRTVGNAVLLKKDLGNATPIGFTAAGSFFYGVSKETAEILQADTDPSGRVTSTPTPLPGRFVGSNSAPDYSWDGRFLAYHGGSTTSSDAGIRILELETGRERRLPRPLVNVAQLRWYPDGRSLLVYGGAGDGTSQFQKLDVETGASTTLLAGLPTFAAVNPTFSKDGRYLYYEIEERGANVLMRMELTTGDKEVVYRPTPPAVLRLYSLSPDGSQLVFNLRHDEQDFLYTKPVTGGEPRLLYPYPADGWARAWGGLAWTADGQSVLYHLASASWPDEMTRIPLATGVAEVVVKTGMIRRIAVRPDGRRLAWEARERSTELWKIDNVVPRD